jgi:transposase
MPQPIRLSETERTSLLTFLHRGKASARIFTRAQILLKLAEGEAEGAIAATFGVCPQTVANVRQRYGSGGLEAVLTDKRQQRRRQALSDPQAAHLIAIACSPAPDGHDHWPLRLLADKAVELGYVTGISPETIRQLLKKTSSNPGSMSSGAFPQ